MKHSRKISTVFIRKGDLTFHFLSSLVVPELYENPFVFLSMCSLGVEEEAMPKEHVSDSLTQNRYLAGISHIISVAIVFRGETVMKWDTSSVRKHLRVTKQKIMRILFCEGRAL
ncbi:hypothetical protein CEXT_326051 [Caerostris extrusa]|uniref:Uncharacterized protein n=1 Tax=Caerostris extrusa TaxID=172846 RepID=A0AAV4X133_CAEEX|nr:hypothetical protein CEXT_326051 [Caerostris extrusa]